MHGLARFYASNGDDGKSLARRLQGKSFLVYWRAQHRICISRSKTEDWLAQQQVAICFTHTSAFNGLKPQDKPSYGNNASFAANQATSRERDCWFFKASLQMKKSEGNLSSLFIIESNLISGTENSWCVDYGASVHVSNSLQGFRKLSEGDLSLYMGNRRATSLGAEG